MLFRYFNTCDIALCISFQSDEPCLNVIAGDEPCSVPTAFQEGFVYASFALDTVFSADTFSLAFASSSAFLFFFSL